MEESINPTITLGPVSFNLTLLAMTLISVFAVFGFIYWASRKMSIRPKGKQNVLEYAYDFVVGFTKGNIGEHYIKDYSLFLFVLFLFLLVANNIGLMAKIETTNGYNLWTSPTANLGYDFAFSFRRNSQTWCEGIFKGFCDTRVYDTHEYFGRINELCLLGTSDLRKYLCG